MHRAGVVVWVRRTARVPRPLQVNMRRPRLWPECAVAAQKVRKSSSADSASRTWNCTVCPTRTRSVIVIAPLARSTA